MGTQEKHLNCYKPKKGDVCVQLNCYTGPDDTVFKNNLREFEAKMMACEPEPEDLNPVPGAPTPAAATPANAPGAAAEAGPQAPPTSPAAAPAAQGVDRALMALSVILTSKSSSTSSASKRQCWRKFL